MVPGPRDFVSQRLGIAGPEEESSSTIFDDFLHSSQSGRDDRRTTGECLGNRDGEVFIPFAREDQETRILYGGDRMLARQGTLKVQTGDIPPLGVRLQVRPLRAASNDQ